MSVPFDQPRSDSRVLPPTRDDTQYDLPGITATRSALIPLVEGNDALGARLRMIEAAKSSIDINTFLIKPDIAGSLYALALISAADRGVRVRLLVDDVFTTANDASLAALDDHPNIEVRLFNPASRNSPVFVSYALDFGRLNRRMHNKAFVIDGNAAIVGGRNIADEYYQIGTGSEFADFDMFIAGPAVRDISIGFDTYWVDRWAVPIAALHPRDESDSLKNAIAAYSRAADLPEAEIYRRAVESTYLADIRAGRITPRYGRVEFVADPPAKLRLRQGGDQQATARQLFTAIDRAKRDVTILTPYFVPEPYGAAFLSKVASRGVRVRVVTNSLAANNHDYVHGGYTPYRQGLIEAGVELFEVRGDLPEGPPGQKLTMHTKLAVIDDRVWVGSMNYDPRSVKLNSELGMLIDSPDLAEALRSRLDSAIGVYAWRPEVQPDGGLRWYGQQEQRQVYVTDEPGASGWSKFVAGVTRILGVEGQL